MIRKCKEMYSNSGSPVKKVFKPKILENGSVELIPVGEDNIYEKIQADRDSCDINILIKRFVSGDVDALNRTQGFYADISNMPKTYLEMLNTVKGAETAFYQLPLEIREKFDNNFNLWFSSMETEDWYKKMTIKKEDIVVPVNEKEGEN